MWSPYWMARSYRTAAATPVQARSTDLLTSLLRHPSFSVVRAVELAASLPRRDALDLWSRTTDLLGRPLDARTRLDVVLLREALLTRLEQVDTDAVKRLEATL